MILSKFQWWRRLRGGRWVKLDIEPAIDGPTMHAWIRLDTDNRAQITPDEDYTPGRMESYKALDACATQALKTVYHLDRWLHDAKDATARSEAAAAHWERAYRDARKELTGKAINAKRAINAIAKHVHHANERWWQNLETGEPLDRNVGEMLMLTVSELAEAMEGHRKGLMDDKLPHRPMFEVELADTVIRILDIAAGLGYDIGGAFVEKMNYNATRKDHTREARLADGGKKY